MIDHYQVAAANQEEEILNLKKNLEEKMIEKENLIQKQSENDQVTFKKEFRLLYKILQN